MFFDSEVRAMRMAREDRQVAYLRRLRQEGASLAQLVVIAYGMGWAESLPLRAEAVKAAIEEGK